MLRVLTWWRNLREPPPAEGEEDRPRPSPAYPVLAAGVLAVAMYGWASWDVLPPYVFYPVCGLVWLAALLFLRAISFPKSQGQFSEFVRDAGQRTGLIQCERIGAVVSIGLAAWSFTMPHLLPVAGATLYGFVRLLISEHKQRELKRLRRPLVKPLPPPTEDDGAFVSRDFQWTMRAGVLADDHFMSVDVHLPTYERMQRDNPKVLWRGDVPLFERWIVDGSTAEVDRAAFGLNEIADERRYSTFAEISNALAFVQSIPYTTDLETKGVDDYWRYPVETVYDQTGDCDDTTILAAAVLRRLGHRVGTMLLPGHAALAVEAPPGTPGDFVMHQGRAMYYCETTADGWKVGELPEGLRGKSMRLFMVPE